MDQTPYLKLPLIMPSQAQKHVTHNEALMLIDNVVQLAVIDRFVAVPPPGAADSDRYIVPPGASGDWTGHGKDVACRMEGAWAFLTPAAGWRCWVESDSAELVFDGDGWIDAASAGLSLHNLAGIGINATYDGTTPFVVSAPSSLLTGSGSHRLKVNKAAAGDTASVIFQTANSGRAEFGTAGDDDFHVKVSANGTTWREAIVVSATSGVVTFPNTPPAPGRNLLINPSLSINQRGFAGGSLAANTYEFDRWNAGSGGASVSVSSGTVTLTSGEIVQPVEAGAFGLAGFAGLSVTFSLSALSGPLRVTVGSATHDFAAASGRQSFAFSVPGGHSGSLNVKLAPLSGALTYSAPKLEVGGTATLFIENTLMAEELLCSRYFWRLRGTLADVLRGGERELLLQHAGDADLDACHADRDPHARRLWQSARRRRCECRRGGDFGELGAAVDPLEYVG